MEGSSLKILPNDSQSSPPQFPKEKWGNTQAGVFREPGGSAAGSPGRNWVGLPSKITRMSAPPGWLVLRHPHPGIVSSCEPEGSGPWKAEAAEDRKLPAEGNSAVPGSEWVPLLPFVHTATWSLVPQ